MNCAGVKYCDVANGPGCRTVLFVSGCRNACPNCFQPHTWDFRYGNPFDEELQQEILDSLAPDYVQGLTLLGGEPFEEENQSALVPFLRRVRAQYPNRDVWAFTGYVYDRDLISGGKKHTKDTDAMLAMIDVLVDGPFVEAEKDMTLKFRGSRNQRLLDLSATRKNGRLCLLPD